MGQGSYFLDKKAIIGDLNYMRMPPSAKYQHVTRLLHAIQHSRVYLAYFLVGGSDADDAALVLAAVTAVVAA